MRGRFSGFIVPKSSSMLTLGIHSCLHRRHLKAFIVFLMMYFSSISPFEGLLYLNVFPFINGVSLNDVSISIFCNSCFREFTFISK